jgi:hypothetical protein
MKYLLLFLLLAIFAVSSGLGYAYPFPVGFHGFGREGGDEAPGYRAVYLGNDGLERGFGRQ